jgi:hypothetical protein
MRIKGEWQNRLIPKTSTKIYWDLMPVKKDWNLKMIGFKNIMKELYKKKRLHHRRRIIIIKNKDLPYL